jgi:hypothetical protein
MSTIGGDRGKQLLQHGRHNVPLARIEHGECLAQNGCADVEHVHCRGSPLISEDHRDRAVITARPPLRPALSNELIDDTHRGRLRPGQLPSQLLDPEAWLLRENCQPGAHRAGMPGSRLNS